MNSALTLKTFTDTGCATHLIGCRATKDAVLIDPKAGQTETYLETARRMGLRIRFVLDTHTRTMSPTPHRSSGAASSFG